MVEAVCIFRVRGLEHLEKSSVDQRVVAQPLQQIQLEQIDADPHVVLPDPIGVQSGLGASLEGLQRLVHPLEQDAPALPGLGESHLVVKILQQLE